MYDIPLIFAYFSPETVLPLTSIIATIVGGAMLIQRSSLRFVVRCCRAALSSRRLAAGRVQPHFDLNEAKPTEKAPQ